MGKIKFNNSRGLDLIGILNKVGSDKIIIMAHGFLNDKSSNGRFDRLSASLNSIGYDTLAFDFSGCGESDTDPITSENQVDDLNCAMRYVLSQGYKKIGLFGNSFGTLACLRCYNLEIMTMILTGALTDSMKYNWNEFFTTEQLNELDGKGFFYYRTSSDRKDNKIVKQTLFDFEQINQKELVGNVKCPVLIIHGNNNNDSEELELLKRSKTAIELMSNNSKLEIIEGAKHGLRNEWDKVIDMTCKWYSKHIM
jgi:pimeloyl-ACP methyl ester carboxylesterase